MEVAERTARIDAAAKIEVARITSAAPPQPAPIEPASAVQTMAAMTGEGGEAPEPPELGMNGQPLPPEQPGQPEGLEPPHGEDGRPYVPGQIDPD